MLDPARAGQYCLLSPFSVYGSKSLPHIAIARSPHAQENRARKRSRLPPPSLRPHPDLLRHLSPSSTHCVPPYSVSLSTRFRRMMQTTRMALQRRAFASSQAAFASVRHHPHLPSPSRGTCVDSVCPRVLACVASAAIYERRFGRSSSIAWSDPTMLPPLRSAPPLMHGSIPADVVHVAYR